MTTKKNKKKATITVKVVDKNKPTAVSIANGKSITITETADLVTGNEGDYYTDATSVPIDAWEMGRRYTYKLTINLFKIFVDPTVEAWNDFVPEQDLNL